MCDCGGELVRTKEVLDVWFDSGAMPFAQDHYPFENKDWLKKGYPADFISEAIDQTRGWFYTLHAVGVLMGRGMAYKNVICLGHLLDKDGKKMSKSQGNVIDPWLMIEKYGVDTLRLWMYSVNQPGESKNFDEKTVAELHNKVFNLLYNVITFYELYRDKNLEKKESNSSKNILDKWILAKFYELVEVTTKNLDNYKLLEPTRAIREFIDDLSTWYLRRSRERIKDGDLEAKQTLYFVLKNLVKVMAPLAPFASEDIWQKLKNDKDVKSVHLAEWPGFKKHDKDILSDMQSVKEICTVGNMLRKTSNIPIRQPLATLFVTKDIHKEYVQIIKDELNVKEIKKSGEKISFDINITPELKQEGNYREFVRFIQDMRKETMLTPNDLISISIKTNEEGGDLITKFKKEFLKTVGAKEINFIDNNGTEIKIDNLVFVVKISK
jgi:isoleucyl-tRNA synthetase